MAPRLVRVCVAAAGLSLAAGMGLQAAPLSVQPNAAADSVSATRLSASESRISAATSLLASSDRSQGGVGGIVGDIGLLATAGEAESIPEGIVLMASGADGLDVVHSVHGHDGFLVEQEQVGALARRLLDP